MRGTVLYRASSFYCNLICELLHVLIINPKGLEVYSLGSTPGHTTIFELALLIDPILCGAHKGPSLEDGSQNHLEFSLTACIETLTTDL